MGIPHGMSLFKNLRFFLVPPGGSQSVAIKKTAFQKHGATIVPSLGDEPTHVLVDSRAVAGVPEIYWTGKWLLLKDSWASESIAAHKQLPAHSFSLRPNLPKESEPAVPGAGYLSTPGSPSPPKLQPAQPRHGLAKAEPKRSTAKRRLSAAESQKPKRARSVVLGTKPSIVDSDNTTDTKMPRQSPELPFENVPSNQTIADVLLQLATERDAGGKEFSKRAYARAAKAIQGSKIQITSGEEAKRLFPSTFGSKLVIMVDEIINGKIPPEVLEKMRKHSQVLALFQTIYGVGSIRARELYDKGYRTLDDVAAHCKDERMLVSIKHHDDFIERIPREEVSQLFDKVRIASHKVRPDAQVYCMGSYRRGQPDCGDVDVVLTCAGHSATAMKELTTEVVTQLFKDGVATYTFGGGEDSRRWIGTVALPGGRWRRLDILAVQEEEMGAAMIYYTGNEHFNRALRFRAGRLGLSLNEKALSRNGEILESRDEHRIFKLLGVEWCKPTERFIENFRLSNQDS